MLKFQQQQADFAAFIRDPSQKKGMDGNIEQRRLDIYSDLLFNNMEGFLSNGFPVLRSLINHDQWLMMVRQFLQNHYCQTPYFLEICEEFIDYISEDDCPIYQQLPDIAPFLLSLAHYEWLELALSVSDAEFTCDKTAFPPAILELTVMVSPLVMPASYVWPVHEIAQDNLPLQAAEQAMCYVVYRNRDDNVEFLQTNAATLRLIALCQLASPLNVKELIEKLADELNQPSEKIQGFVIDLLKQLHALDIISHFE